MREEEVDVTGRGQTPAVAAAHRGRVLGTESVDDATDGLLDHLDLFARDP